MMSRISYIQQAGKHKLSQQNTLENTTTTKERKNKMIKVKKDPRQGDLRFVARREQDTSLNKEHKDYRADGIIREGEEAGHMHRIEDPSTADVFVPMRGMPVVNVYGTGATVVHPQHGREKLEPNTTYDVHVGRSEDPLHRTPSMVSD